MVLDYDETLFLGKVKKYGIITSYTEIVIYFFIECGIFGPQGMPNGVKNHGTRVRSIISTDRTALVSSIEADVVSMYITTIPVQVGVTSPS